ncbi:hypothetical protein B0684_00720 [Thioalkalivibrio versutus]|nr:hypothetical protein B0684_00720 [Thioalkalivibrio versutus]
MGASCWSTTAGWAPSWGPGLTAHPPEAEGPDAHVAVPDARAWETNVQGSRKGSRKSLSPRRHRIWAQLPRYSGAIVSLLMALSCLDDTRDSVLERIRNLR